MSFRLPLIISFIVYGLGILCMFVADLYVVANYSPEEVANWAFYKSALFILGAFCLLGLDQVIIRHPDKAKNITLRFIGTSLAVTAALSAICFTYEDIPVAPAMLIICTLLFSYVTFISAYFRAKNKLVEAQIATNGWKPIAFLLMVTAFGGVDSWFLFSLSTTLIVFLPLLLLRKYKDNYKSQQVAEQNYSQLGGFFLLHSLTLVIAVHGEQFIITLLGNKEVAFVVFSHFVIFTPIAISANGFLGFYLAPKIRRMDSFDLVHYKTYANNINKLAIGLSVISMIAGIAIYQLVYKRQGLELDLTIVASLFIMTLARGNYTFASVCMNVFADKRVLFKTAVFNWASMTIYLLCLFIILNSDNNNLAMAQMIVIATALHWLARTVTSNYYASQAVKVNLKKIEVNP